MTPPRPSIRFPAATTRTLLATAMAATLAACGGTPAGGGARSSSPPAPASATIPLPPARAGAATAAHSTPEPAPGFDGVGPLRFGMTSTQIRRAWGAPLSGQAPAKDPQACYYLAPDGLGNDVRFMLEGDRFVRVDVNTDRVTAPGGGRIGMRVSQLEKLYAGRVTLSPNKYDATAKVLRVAAGPAGDRALVFEADASGTVTSWRIGVRPQIDYVEGCS